jgi:hypothetical protein
MKIIQKPFKPKAKLLLELGDQLIKDEGIALFELVKNSYDADASSVQIEMHDIDSLKNGEISITDDGSGMVMDTVLGVWLEPGTNFRQKQLSTGFRTKKYKRVPLGEKGIGRFGAHKLGKKIELVTRAKSNNEIVVEINWENFEKDEYLEKIQVTVKERKPLVFIDNKTGTRIKISNLRSLWNRGMVRDLYRAVNSICSPVKTPGSFNVTLKLLDNDKNDWLDKLFSWKDALNYRLFHATCVIDGNKLKYSYEFLPWEVMNKVTKRKDSKEMVLIDPDDKTKKIIDLNKYKIGKVSFEINIYDLEYNGLGNLDRYNGLTTPTLSYEKTIYS